MLESWLAVARSDFSKFKVDRPLLALVGMQGHSKAKPAIAQRAAEAPPSWPL
jgi:hypothetical protein